MTNFSDHYGYVFRDKIFQHFIGEHQFPSYTFRIKILQQVLLLEHNNTYN